jgi:hypothetical protein
MRTLRLLIETAYPQCPVGSLFLKGLSRELSSRIGSSLLALILLLTGCLSEGPPPAQMAAGSTPGATTTAHEEQTAPQSESSTALCSPTSLQHTVEQTNYKGVFPGVTTADELIHLLGEPVQRLNYEPGVAEWLYPYEDGPGNFPVGIRDGKVEGIYRVYDYEEKPRLSEILVQFGCPDVVYAVELYSEHPSGNYSAVSLIYLQGGLELTIPSLPVELDDEASQIWYFASSSYEDWLKQRLDMQYPERAKQTTLDDALRWQR